MVASIQKDGLAVVINKGSSSGVKEGMHYLIYNKGSEIMDPETNVSLGTLEIVCGKENYSGTLRLFAPFEGMNGLERLNDETFKLELSPGEKISFGTPSEIKLHDKEIKYYSDMPIAYGKKGFYFDKI